MAIVGTEKFSSAIGLVLLMEAFAVLVGPPGAGQSVEKSVSVCFLTSRLFMLNHVTLEIIFCYYQLLTFYMISFCHFCTYLVMVKLTWQLHTTLLKKFHLGRTSDCEKVSLALVQMEVTTDAMETLK